MWALEVLLVEIKVQYWQMESKFESNFALKYLVLLEWDEFDIDQ